MAIERVTGLGNINISQEAIATLAGGVVSECYGVVGMASQKVFKDGIAELLKKFHRNALHQFLKFIVMNTVMIQMDLNL